jgi:1-acyl-sn-glycerol-3-phosphate acyltransferase
MLPLIRSMAFVMFQAISVSIWGTLFILVAPFLSPSNRYRFAMRWPAMSSWAAKTILGIRVRIRGEDNLTKACTQPVIVCAKHQSAWETLFLPSYLPRQLCFVFKRELLRIPFFGWGIGLLPMIHVNRSDGRRAYANQTRSTGEVQIGGRTPGH